MTVLSPSAARPLPPKQPDARQQAPQATPAPAEPADWTVLVFLNGHNNLEGDEVRNVFDMENVGSTDQVKIAVQLARSPQKEAHPHRPHDHLDGDWTGVRRYCIGKAPDGSATRQLASTPIQELPPSTDMGDPAVFAEFLKWGIEKYPAKNYLVVVNDHGAGFMGTSYDDLHESHFSMPGLQSALAGVQKDTGVTPGILMFDACEMGQTEVGYEFRTAAKFMVGSEEIVGGVGLPYSKFLRALTEKPDMTPEQAARAIVKSVAEDESGRRAANSADSAVELAAVDLGQMTPLREACDNLSRSIRSTHLPVTVLQQAIGKTKHFNRHYKDHPGEDYRDLGDFAQHLKDSPSADTAVKQAATQVQAALKQAVVSDEDEGAGQQRDHGMSIYLPLHYGKDRKPAPAGQPPRDPHWKYPQLDMAKDGEWGKLLEYISRTR